MYEQEDVKVSVIDKNKGYNLNKIRNKNRWADPEYIDYVLEKFKDKFPDNIPERYVVRNCINFFIRYIDETIRDEKEVSLRGFGKFKLEKRIIKSPKSKNIGDEQYYPKFDFSNKYIRHIRYLKGTSTLSELQDMRKDKEWKYNMWKQRHAYRLQNNMTISPNNQKKFAQATIEYKTFLDNIDKLERLAFESQNKDFN